MRTLIIVVIGLLLLFPYDFQAFVGCGLISWGYYRMGHEEGEKVGIRKAFSKLKRK